MSSYTIPERSTAFVAYHRTPITSPDESGQPVEFRAQSFVREFPTVKVASIGEVKEIRSKRNDDVLRTCNVTFDARSTGIPNFTNDFTASIRVDDPGFEWITKAHENGAELLVAVETIRNHSVRGTKDEIDPHTTIAELRGAPADNSAGNANTTRDHCKNVIALVAPAGRADMLRITTEGASNPDEWPQLRANKDGSYAPAGWRPQAGGIVNAPTTTNVPAAAPTGVGEKDMEALARRIVALMPAAGQPTARWEDDKSRRPRPQIRDHRSSEARTYEMWNSDGTLNDGSTLMEKQRYVWTYAVRKLAAMGYVEGVDVVAEANRLTTLLLWITDRVHENVTGGGWGKSRTLASHKEAGTWVTSVIDNLSGLPGFEVLQLTPQVMSDKAVSGQWAKAVIEQASSLFAHWHGEAERYLDPQAAAQPTGSAPSAQSAQSARSPQSATQQGPTAAQQPPASSSSPTLAERTQQPQPAAATPVPAPQPQTSTDPWDTPAPAGGDPWASSAPQPANHGGSEHLRGRWHYLIHQSIPGMEGFEHRCDAWLVETFGTSTLSDIDPANFTRALNHIAANPENKAGFANAAKAAATKVTQ